MLNFCENQSFVNFGPLKSQLCICIWGSTKCLYLGVHKVSVFGGPQSICIWGSTKYLYLGVHKVSVFGGPQSICIWGSTKYLYLGVHKVSVFGGPQIMVEHMLLQTNNENRANYGFFNC